MLDESLRFTPDDGNRLERACRAAEFCGRATAMVVNLYSAGQFERADVWQQEQAVWEKRRLESADLLPHHQAVSAELEKLTHAAYVANLVPRVH